MAKRTKAGSRKALCSCCYIMHRRRIVAVSYWWDHWAEKLIPLCAECFKIATRNPNDNGKLR
jgi:hypothetical protein